MSKYGFLFTLAMLLLSNATGASFFLKPLINNMILLIKGEATTRTLPFKAV